MKRLKFSEPLPKLILSGKKDTTWRINDEKDIVKDDELSLCYNNGKEFARARVIWVSMTTFGNLTEEELKGHENFLSKEEMYKTYSKYYKSHITPETKVKVIKFKILK